MNAWIFSGVGSILAWVLLLNVHVNESFTIASVMFGDQSQNYIAFWSGASAMGWIATVALVALAAFSFVQASRMMRSRRPLEHTSHGEIVQQGEDTSGVQTKDEQL